MSHSFSDLQEIGSIVNSSPVRNEFSEKIKELDRRLKLNGMEYSQWDTLTDHQQGIFSQNLFADGVCAASVEEYVRNALESCGCPDSEDDLQHHSPALAAEIEKRRTPEDADIFEEGLEGLNNAIESLFEGVRSGKLALKEEDADPSITSKKDRARQFVLSLPKFVPTEKWGDPDTFERQQVEKIFHTVGGGASIEKKIEFIKRTIDNPTGRIRSPQRIIGNLILLESLSAVINSFSSSPAGYVLEGFMSALLGGTTVTGRTAGGSLLIQDFLAFSEWGRTAPVPVSLKLLKDDSKIKGSYTNLVSALNEYELVVYLVARKVGDEISLEQFVITRDNIEKVLFGTRKEETMEKILAIIDAETGKNLPLPKSMTMLATASDWEEKYALLQQTAGHAADAQKASSGGKQFEISAPHLRAIADIAEHKLLGTLPISPEKIIAVAESYMDNLSDSLTDLFEATANLSDNINKYFTYDKRSEAIDAGKEAIRNSETVSREVQRDIAAGGAAGSS